MKQSNVTAVLLDNPVKMKSPLLMYLLPLVIIYMHCRTNQGLKSIFGLLNYFFSGVQVAQSCANCHLRFIGLFRFVGDRLKCF